MSDIPSKDDDIEPINMATEFEIVKANIHNHLKDRWTDTVQLELQIANGLLRLWKIVEQEIRRIDNEVTEVALRLKEEDD